MQSALRSATRRAVSISSRRGVATSTTDTTKAAAATAIVPERDLVAENEKAWVATLVQREVRAQMLAAEERRITRDCDSLRAAAEEIRRLADAVEEPWPSICAGSGILAGWLLGFAVAAVLFGR